MTRPRPITQAQREALVKAGWQPDLLGGEYGREESGWWWPPDPYTGNAFSGREALRELARRAKRAKGAKP
jgi:hypothetical protein